MKILTIDLATGKTAEKPLPDLLIGGRWLTSHLTSEMVDPTTDPLGPGNILAMAAGPLSGRRISTGGRLSIGGKSPLTGGIKETNAGGMAGDSLAALGWRALVFTGERPAGKPAVAILDETGLRLEDAAPFWGLWNTPATQALRKAFGQEYVCISIGPAGEQKMKAAGIAVTDANNQPFRLAARGGMGAVMGAKGLKAVLVKRIGRQNLNTSKPARDTAVEFNKYVAASPRVGTLRTFGTSETVMMVEKLGGLPTRNFTVGSFEHAEAIGGETMRELILARGGVGTPTEACMSGCVIQCSTIFPKPDGTLACAPVEFETLGLVGSNCALGTLDEIARVNWLCNEIGLDTIDVGAALGVMMEAAQNGSAPAPYRDLNLPHFGDGARAAEVVEEIAAGGPLGSLVGNGVVHTGKALGSKRIPAVKGQALSAYDPRVVKGTGVTYCTSPQGADHSAGLTVFAPIDHTDAAIAVEASRKSQIQRAGYDSLGLCVFNISATGMQPQFLLNMLRTAYAMDLPDTWLGEMGLNVIRLEKAFNRAAGMTAADDRLPEYFVPDRVQPRGTVFDVSEAEMDRMFD